MSAPQYRTLAIVGINRESAALLGTLLETHKAIVAKIINPDFESLEVLRTIPNLDAIVNTTGSDTIHAELKQLCLSSVDILSGLSARILFSSTTSHTAVTSSTDRKNVLESLSELKAAVFLSKNKDELLKLLLSVAISTCNADSGSIMLADSRKRVLKIEMANGLGSDVVKTASQRYGSGIAGKVARSGKAILLTPETIASDPSLHLVRKDITSSICCPLLIAKEVVGVLNISSKNPATLFTTTDLIYMQELSDFAADAIYTSREHDETASSHFGFALIAHIQEILTHAVSYDERLNLIVMRIANSFNAVICNYYSCVPEQKMFLIEASSSFNRNLLQGKKIKLNDHIAASAIDSKGPVIIDGGLNEEGHRKWYVAIPLRSTECCIGLLFVHFILDKEVITSEIDLLAKVAGMLSEHIGGHKKLEQLHVQSTRLSAISEVTFTLATAASLADLVNCALPNACLILEAEAALFWLLNPTTDTLELYSSFTIDDTVNRNDLEKIDMKVYSASNPKDDAQLLTDLAPYGFPSDKGFPRSLISKSFGNGATIAAVLTIFGRKSLDLYGSKRFTQSDKEVFMKFCLQFSKGLCRLVPFFAANASIRD